jgi:hypothetical protein
VYLRAAQENAYTSATNDRNDTDNEETHNRHKRKLTTDLSLRWPTTISYRIDTSSGGKL